MKENAEREGRKLVRGFGTRARDEKFWYYDVWIEGSEQNGAPWGGFLNFGPTHGEPLFRMDL